MLRVDLHGGKGCGYLSGLGISAVGLEWTDHMAVLFLCNRVGERSSLGGSSQGSFLGSRGLCLTGSSLALCHGRLLGLVAVSTASHLNSEWLPAVLHGWGVWVLSCSAEAASHSETPFLRHTPSLCPLCLTVHKTGTHISC